MSDSVEVVHDIKSILTSTGTNYLVRNNGDQVAMDTLNGKKLGIYYSASWCGSCQRFTPNLVEVYNELLPKVDLEIIFISSDEDLESFNGYFSKMPWLAVPFSDFKTRGCLDGSVEVDGIPHPAFFDENGKLLTYRGVEIIGEYGAEVYPFTPERFKEIEDEEEEARKNQSLRTILESRSRDYVISANGKKVNITDLEGKTVGLYFMLSSFESSTDFTPTLIKVYNELKSKQENFEIVSTFPTLVIIGQDGQTLHPDVVDAIEEHGINAYPFTPDKFSEIEKAKQESQTLESFLVSGDLDYVIGKDNTKVEVSDLVGKHVLLYFSAHWCPPCRAFTPKLVETYHEIKNKHNNFEVIVSQC
uniref:protein-disulfide reductase n=1 Tax=Lactuca sativa TaxID=4236 RepID=A0A9R1W2D0_LACSA|nr:hypothetical protein LSAT_V11C300112340 [Lactuca sativa]